LSGKFLSVNHAGASLLGYTKEEVLNLTLFDIIPEERHNLLDKYLVELKTNGKANGQMVTRHKDGSLKIWLYHNVLENATGNETYVIGNAVDITEKHLLETKLSHTSEMLQQTNALARVGGWNFDIEKQKITWSTITKEIHGVGTDYEPELDSALNFFKEGESRDKITLAVTEAVNLGKAYNLDVQLINTQNREVWVRALGLPEFENGKLKRLYGAIQDIDDYKQAEIALKQSVETQDALNKVLIEQIDKVIQQDKTIETIQELKFLADSIPQIVWTSHPDGNLDYYNRHWFDYTGMTLEQTIGWGWAPILHPDDLENCIKVWTESFTTGKPYEVEYRFKRASDGAYRWHLGRALPMRDAAGNIVKWFGSCTDIDEYKRALDLENKITQYEDFNRIVAHNLRGPAGSIGMMLDMISESEDEADKEDLLSMLKESSKTLNGTLDELMSVLEIRLSKHIEFDDCDVTEIISGVSKMLNGQILSKKAVITCDLNVPIIQFPRIYLESIVYNMISNSLKYSNSEIAPIIHIQSDKVNGRVQLRFKDNGLGIDLKKHGMNMFQLNKVFHKGFDSKGVGLFMTKTQIETFGGSIQVESEPNVGSEFTITL
jgi:PAS domain S-box-containing protein